jgi:hypothetical protein
MDESGVMTAPKRYFLRHLLWAFPTRLVRTWYEAKLYPAEVVRLVNEAFVCGLQRAVVFAGCPGGGRHSDGSKAASSRVY